MAHECEASGQQAAHENPFADVLVPERCGSAAVCNHNGLGILQGQFRIPRSDIFPCLNGPRHVDRPRRRTTGTTGPHNLTFAIIVTLIEVSSAGKVGAIADKSNHDPRRYRHRPSIFEVHHAQET